MGVAVAEVAVDISDEDQEDTGDGEDASARAVAAGLAQGFTQSEDKDEDADNDAPVVEEIRRHLDIGDAQVGQHVLPIDPGRVAHDRGHEDDREGECGDEPDDRERSGVAIAHIHGGRVEVQFLY